MQTADVVTAVLLIVVAGIVLYDSASLGMGWGPDGPQSGFFPFWLAIILLAACLGILAQARRRKAAPFVSRAQLRSVLTVLCPATAAVILMQFVGLYVASALYMGFYMRWVGRHSWVTVVLIGVGVPLLTFIVFEQWFLVPMPKGPLEHMLGY
jgi:hypothetical protein